MGIDVVVGGQYGDEAKGQIAAHLAKWRDYRFSVRVGGSNAEHRFFTNSKSGVQFTARVIPTAAWVEPNIKLVIGAGHMICLESLQREIRELEQLWGQGDAIRRLFIDPQAGVIPEENKGYNEETAWRGSTHQGVGASVAHKALRDGDFKLARDYEELKPYLADTPLLMYEWLKAGYHGLFEGSQGALLSLDLGYYPYNTSKNVTPAGMLGEAGIATKFLREIFGVYRTVPMRVPGNSGPTGGKEITWEELERRAGIEIPRSKKIQTDSGDRERVFEWSWDDFRRSVAIVGPDQMALTFADWYHGDLDSLIAGMEEIADAPVTLVRTGPEWDDHYERGPYYAIS